MRWLLGALAVLCLVSGALLLVSWRTTQAFDPARDTEDHDWYCGDQLCVRTWSECDLFCRGDHCSCISQDRVACFHSRAIIKDRTRVSCYSTITRCEEMQKTETTNRDVDDLSDCAVVDLAGTARLQTYAKAGLWIAAGLLAFLLILLAARGVGMLLAETDQRGRP